MHVVIIGNGITGVTAARYIRKQGDAEITIVSKESDHFYSRTALMYIYMGHMSYADTKPYADSFWAENRINLLRGAVTGLQPDAKTIQLDDGTELSYDKLIIATGAKSNKFGWPGQDLDGVQGLYNLQDLESMVRWTAETRRAVIVGGGLIGIEMAEMFLSRNIPVTFLVRENLFWSNILPREEAEMVGRHIREHHVDLRLKTEMKEILSDENGRARAVVTTSGEEIECQFVGLTAGVSPNVDWLQDAPVEVDRGILINEYFETGLPDIYAGGDCAQFRTPLPARRPVEQVWYTGKMHGRCIADNLLGKASPYEPGVWFNSAKFFDIEYQTYGMVWAKLPEDEQSFYWEHDSGKQSLRINYRKDTRAVTGFNLFGMRGRHSVCEQWIVEQKTIEHVLQHLGAMNFDPEFFEQCEPQIVHAFNAGAGKDPLPLETRKGLFSRYLLNLSGRGQA